MQSLDKKVSDFFNFLNANLENEIQNIDNKSTELIEKIKKQKEEEDSKKREKQQKIVNEEFKLKLYNENLQKIKE